jgi:hypothetical protein
MYPGKDVSTGIARRGVEALSSRRFLQHGDTRHDRQATP